MRASLIFFLAGLNHLRHYIKGLDFESDILAAQLEIEDTSGVLLHIKELQSHYKSALSKKKQFDYNSIIVSLYGYVEQYVESMLRAYVSGLNLIVPSYDLLPSAITNNHIELSFGLISRSEQSLN